MAAISGSGGSVTFATGYVTNVKSFTLDIAGEALDSTDFASVGVREFVPGLTGWSGSYTCNLDDTTAVTGPGASPAAAVFTASAARTYSGTIIVTSVSPSVAADALNEVVVSFQGSAALTPA